MKSPNFRTHAEMRNVYTEIESMPGHGRPYCITQKDANHYFGFIGTSHTSDPNHPQWGRYHKEWEDFIHSPNQDKVVIFEGNARSLPYDATEDVIKHGGDSGLTVWLARKAGIEHMSPEPDRKAEIEKLIEQGFSEDDLITYYIGRQIPQWRRRDHYEFPDMDEYNESVLRYLDVYPWENHYSAQDVRQLVESAVGKRLEDIGDGEVAMIADPSLNVVSSASGRLRDIALFGAIKEAWEAGKDVFCVYGSGHAIVLEPALKELIEKR